VFSFFINDLVKEKINQNMVFNFYELGGSVPLQTESLEIRWDEKKNIILRPALMDTASLTSVVTTFTYAYLDGYVSHLDPTQKNRVEFSKTANGSYNQKIYKEGKLLAENAIIKKKDSEIIFSQLGIDPKGQPIIHITETFTVMVDSSTTAVGLKNYNIAEGKKIITHKSETFRKTAKDKITGNKIIKETIRSSVGEQALPEQKHTFIISYDLKGNVTKVECKEKKKRVEVGYSTP
jgi:hypothetical protein